MSCAPATAAKMADARCSLSRALTTAESRGYARDLLRASVIYLPLLLTVMMLNATGGR